MMTWLDGFFFTLYCLKLSPAASLNDSKHKTHCFVCVENYERLEADKKKQVHKKRRFEGPTIRYHSVLMPLVSHSVLKEENVDVEG